MKKVLQALLTLYPRESFSDLEELAHFIEDEHQRIHREHGALAARKYLLFTFTDTLKVGLIARKEHTMTHHKRTLLLMTGLLVTGALAYQLPQQNEAPQDVTISDHYSSMRTPQELVQARRNIEKDLQARLVYESRGLWNRETEILNELHFLDEKRTPKFKSTYPTLKSYLADLNTQRQRTKNLPVVNLQTLQKLQFWRTEQLRLCISSLPKTVRIEETGENLTIWETRRPFLTLEKDGTIKVTQQSELNIVRLDIHPAPQGNSQTTQTGPQSAIQTGCSAHAYS